MAFTTDIATELMIIQIPQIISATARFMETTGMIITLDKIDSQKAHP